MNSFKITLPGVLATFIGFFTQLLASYIFVMVFDWGIFGLGLADSFSKLVLAVYLQIVLWYEEKLKEAMYWPTLDS